MKTTKSNNAVKVSEEVMRLRKELNLKADAIADNGYCVWVTAPEKGALSDKLKAEGFAFSSKRGAWWRRSESASAQKPAKTSPKAKKTQPKKTSQPKAEKVYAELPAEVQAQVKAIAQKKFPGVCVTVSGSWVRLSGEATKGQKDAIKAEGFHWASSEDKKYWSREIPQAWMTAPAKTAPKAEPKKAQPKVRKYNQPVMTGLLG